MDQSKEKPTTSPSGATDKTIEREKKFDEEGGDQPQAPSQRAVDDELRHIHEQDQNTTKDMDIPANRNTPPGDGDKTKPSGSEHNDRDAVPVAGR